MIFGTGVDIAKIDRFDIIYEKYQSRFLGKILSEYELSYFEQTREPARFLAMRFAAKEATSKALGTGFKQGVYPSLISVQHAASGKPSLRVSGKVLQLFSEFKIKQSHVSLSDDGGFAFASVILEI
jgi:holo-[acyl-carrier protein] synthase